MIRSLVEEVREGLPVSSGVQDQTGLPDVGVGPQPTTDNDLLHGVVSGVVSDDVHGVVPPGIAWYVWQPAVLSEGRKVDLSCVAG